MADKGFVRGEVVTLKAGGPKMTVSNVDTTGSGPPIRCKWFKGAKLEHGGFYPEELEKVDPKAK